MEKIQKLLKRTIIIFGITTLLQMILGTKLNNETLIQLLELAFAISLVQLLLFQESVFSYSILHQIAFILLVWGMVIGANYMYRWGYHFSNLFLLLGVVLATYFGIRLITYYQVKDEANKMNRFLNKRKKDEIFTSKK